ncbi:phage integrase family protein [Nitrosospira sp. Nsp5]|uniref:tyrosine-type recombinase/integrase n=1 Tax=Nitrosospira TaxID=35798 RepID=UPI0009425A90|nr:MULTISPECIES: tyrosine-type recombinase/integrase [Nitrosospira]PTR10193.1 phage integrase family protein [Nitrosospira sp. Nsp5]
MMETDIRDGALLISQNKGGQKLRMNVTGQLDELLQRIIERKRQFSVRSLALICNERGGKLGRDALRYRFDVARLKATADNPSIADAITAYQFRDLRAKAGTDKADTGDLVQAQKQLGHRSITMTEHYVRARVGEKVEPTK